MHVMKPFKKIACLSIAIAWCVPAFAAESDDEPVLKRCLVSLIDEAKVPAREAGVLVELKVREGQFVGKDELIARIDDSQSQAEKRRASAEAEQARAKSESDVDKQYSVKAEQVAQKAYEKAEKSHQTVQGSVTDVERDRLRLEWEKTGLQIEQADLEKKLSKLAAHAKEVEVEAADIGIERRRITSPLEGEVVEVFPHLGEWLQPGDPLAHVVRTAKLRVEGYVDSARHDPEQVRDRPVTVTVRLANERDEVFKGRIIFVNPRVESGGDYRVWAEVSNRQETGSDTWILRPGQTATMQIHSKSSPLPRRNRPEAAAAEAPRTPAF